MKNNNKKILIATGGTGGHIFPSLSLVNFLKENSQEREKIYFNARKFAENNFDIEKIGKNFNELINTIKL